MRKTVFVVGAGASTDYQLPTGAELRKHIASRLDIAFDYGSQTRGDTEIVEALRHHARTQELSRERQSALLHAARRIRAAMPLAESIDNFIDCHKENPDIALCGKLAIVRAILHAERGSINLYINDAQARRDVNFPELENTWIAVLFKLLVQNCTLNELSERLSAITFVVFNYDRCLEHFLLHALMTYYSPLSPQEAAQIVSKLSIFHPYGVVGFLPWQSPNGNSSIAFGADAGSTATLNLASQIRTFTEGTDKTSSDIGNIRGAIVSAEQIVFLGFAYHPLNMTLLFEGVANSYQGKHCFGTSIGISAENQQFIKNDISRLVGAPAAAVNLSSVGCAKLLEDNWRMLTRQ